MSRVTPAERRALEAWHKHDGAKGAAQALGRSQYTVVRQLDSARKRLGVPTTHKAWSTVFQEGKDPAA
jgi:IS30 family transposase